MHTSNGSLPRDFLWGAATASYQIEGAAHEDGRGESVWDRFAATPGKVRNGDTGEVAAAHHLLLSHGWAAEALRRAAPGAQVGITLNLAHSYPATESPEDEAAAWRVDGEGNRWFLDPIFRGAYPADLLERGEVVAPFVRDGDLAAIAAPVDFLGVNNYFRFVVGAGADGPQMVRDPEAEHTDMGWEVYPDGLHRLLVRVAQEYAPPVIYVTENGAAFGDVRTHDGRVHDPERTAYLESHIEAVLRAAADGAPIGGYFVWSLLDNFEWAYGYAKRFGIVYVDYLTLERVPKDSFYWYRDFIASVRGAPRPSAGSRWRAGGCTRRTSTTTACSSSTRGGGACFGAGSATRRSRRGTRR